MKLAPAVILNILASAALFAQATNVFPSSGNVGIGTTNPSSNNGGVGRILDVSAPGSTNSVVVLENNGAAGSNTGGILEARNATATAGDPRLGQIHWIRGTDTTAGRLNSIFQLYVNNDGTLNNALNILPSGTVGIGTTSPQHKLSVNGTIGAKEVIVTNTGWSDYVFKTGYRLMPLPEVAKYIRKHGHLPEIPSEAEVKEKGIGVGEVQAKLLAKIEELTLHMIQAEERSNRLEQQNRELQEQNRQFQGRIARLEAGR